MSKYRIVKRTKEYDGKKIVQYAAQHFGRRWWCFWKGQHWYYIRNLYDEYGPGRWEYKIKFAEDDIQGHKIRAAKWQEEIFVEEKE